MKELNLVIVNRNFWKLLKKPIKVTIIEYRLASFLTRKYKSNFVAVIFYGVKLRSALLS